ncbi:MAG: hypothetical protein NWE94_09175 [Candidatus Bathyarchaeota archaeon]|nr:hypothetical protein [Candidatus Bathyarchaeota archaeon]
MIPKFRRTKLKTILLIDILIVAIAAGTYIYLQNTGGLASAPKLAEFTLSDLTISPLEADVGEPISISVNVTNIGDLEGNYSATLTINDVEKETKMILLQGGSYAIVDFTDTENTEGNYTVKVGNLTGTFRIKAAPPEISSISLSNLIIRPYEVWLGDQVNATVTAKNIGAATDTLTVKVVVNGTLTETRKIELAAGETTTLNFAFNATNEGVQYVKINSLFAAFTVVPRGMHTLFVVSTPLSGIPFTLEGVEHKTPYSELLPVGKAYTVKFPGTFELQNALFLFAHWEDGTWGQVGGSADSYHTVTLNDRTTIVATYKNTRCCPSLYVWNGTNYRYRTEISAGTGYLGIFNYFRADGSLAFLYSYPWDYVKLDRTQIQPRNGYYDLTLNQVWDEIFYVDSAKLVIVDHSPGVDVFSTSGTYLYNLVNQGVIYTVSKQPSTPTSAFIIYPNGTREDVLSQISTLDSICTSGTEFRYDTLELNLGDLSKAKSIKLVVAGITIYSSGQVQGEWAGQFWNQPGVQPFPPPYMEVKAANGSWVRVPDNRQFPLVDVTSESFVVDLTGLFPTNDYSVRIHSFFDSRFDYIGVDTTPQQYVKIQQITPSYASLSQFRQTSSNSSGYFTRYGDVTALLQAADDEYVIGRQGDCISLQFSTDTLLPVPAGMERDYFFFVSCWFKVDGLPYLAFKVDPLPFHGMSAFPYPDTESYPFSSHWNYLATYNTRKINVP